MVRTTGIARRLSLGLWVVVAGACSDDDAQDASAAVGVDTRIIPAQFAAGETATVECLAFNSLGETLPHVRVEALVAPEGQQDVSGLTVTGRMAGRFSVACRVLDFDVRDPSPAEFNVLAGPASQTVARVDPTTIAAGGTAEAACFVADAFGNPVGGAAYMDSEPDEVGFEAGQASATVAGEYALTCISNDVPEQTFGSATLTVVPGKEAGIELAFVPARRSHPVGKAIDVSANVVDSHGNVIREGLAVRDITVDPGGHHTLTDSTLRFDQEGVFTVTGAAAEHPSWTASAPLAVDETPPELVLTSPERGEVTQNQESVTVSGTVSDNLGVVDSLRIMDTEVALPAEGGAFSVTLPKAYGLTLIDAVATDPYGLQTTVTRAGEESSAYYPMTGTDVATDGVHNAVAFVLAQEAIDDRNHDEAVRDDLASIMLFIVDHLDWGTLVSNPLATFPCINGECTLDFSGIRYSDADVILTLKSGRIHARVEMTDFAAGITLWAPCDNCASNPLPLRGDAVSSFVEIETDVLISVVGGETVASTENTTVTLADFAVDLNDPTGILEGLINVALSFIQDTMITLLEELIAGLLEEQLGGAFASLFSALNIDQTFDVPSAIPGGDPNRIVLHMTPAGVDVAPQRLQLRLDGIAAAETPMRPFSSLGSLDRDGCAPFSSLLFPPAAPVVVGLHDSFINQLLFAVWEGGTLSLDIAAGQADDLIDGFPVQDLALYVEPRLPPVLNSCTGENRLEVGDLFLDATMTFGGQPMHIALWLQTEAAVEVVFQENEAGGLQVQLAIGDLDPLVVELIDNEGFFEGDDPGVITLLKDVIVPQLLSTLSDQATFDLPTIDLGALTNAVPAGTVINIDVADVLRDNAYLTVQGSFR